MDNLKDNKQELEEENQKLRENATQVFIEEMTTNGGIDITMRTGFAPVFAVYVREMLKEKGAENFLNMTFSFTDDEYEKFYMTMGRCDGKTVQEKYAEVCSEKQELLETLKQVVMDAEIYPDQFKEELAIIARMENT